MHPIGTGVNGPLAPNRLEQALPARRPRPTHQAGQWNTGLIPMKLLRTTAAILAASLVAAPLAFAQTAAPATKAPAPAATTAAPAAKAATPAAAPAAQAAPVNLNTASAADLDKLPQIGEARSKAIVAHRPYKNWDDFVAKKVVPSNAEAAIKGKVTF